MAHAQVATISVAPTQKGVFSPPQSNNTPAVIGPTTRANADNDCAAPNAPPCPWGEAVREMRLLNDGLVMPWPVPKKAMHASSGSHPP